MSDTGIGVALRRKEDGLRHVARQRPQLLPSPLPEIPLESLVRLQIRRFRFQRVSKEDARWLRARLERESAKLGTRVEPNANDSLMLGWG